MFGMMAVFAEFERYIIRERTVDGFKAAKARGRKGGRPMTDKKKLDAAIRLYESGDFTVAQIEESTGGSKGSLYRELNRRKQGEMEVMKAYGSGGSSNLRKPFSNSDSLVKVLPWDGSFT